MSSAAAEGTKSANLGPGCPTASSATPTPSLLERYFRKTVGRTVVQELQRVRLEKACYLLRHSETPIGEIGPLCGYGDETYFKIIFRRAYGKSMRDYRRDARKGNG